MYINERSLTVEIIKQGSPPEKKPLDFCCDHCGCEFRVAEEECRRVQSGPNETSLEYECPCCGKKLWYYVL